MGFSFSDLIENSLKADYDMILPITGRKGVGKSVLAHWIAKTVDPYYSLRRNFTFRTDLKTVKHMIFDLEKYSVPIFDEVVLGMDSHDWMGSLQRSLYKIFTITRKENKCSILCIPQFKRLLSGIRNDHCEYWIHVVDRGVAVVFRRDDNPFTSDPWNFKENSKLWSDSSRVFLTPEDKVKILSKSRNYVGAIHFDDWETKKEKEEYMKYYEQEKLAITKELAVLQEKQKKKREPSKLETALRNILLYLNKKERISWMEMAKMAGNVTNYRNLHVFATDKKRITNFAEYYEKVDKNEQKI